MNPQRMTLSAKEIDLVRHALQRSMAVDTRSLADCRNIETAMRYAEEMRIMAQLYPQFRGQFITVEESEAVARRWLERTDRLLSAVIERSKQL